MAQNYRILLAHLPHRSFRTNWSPLTAPPSICDRYETAITFPACGVTHCALIFHGTPQARVTRRQQLTDTHFNPTWSWASISSGVCGGLIHMLGIGTFSSLASVREARDVR